MKTKWQVIEDIDGAYVYEMTKDADDICFGRTPPIAKLNEHAPSQMISEFCAFINGTPRRSRKISRAMRLQREHEAQSNAEAIRDGAIIHQ